MTAPAMESSQRAFVAEVLASWDLAAAPVALLSLQNGTHLRARVTLPDGSAAILRERPAHIPAEDWRLHAELLGGGDWLPPGVPRTRVTRDGSSLALVGDRYFALQSWLPGDATGQLAQTDPVAAAGFLGGVSAWLLSTPTDDLPDRRSAITSDTSTFLPGMMLPRDPTHDLGGLLALLFAENPPGRAVVVHGDPHPYNFLWHDGQPTGLCDWDDAHLNSPAWDLAYFLTHLTFIHWPLHDPRGTGNECRMRERVDIRLTDAVVHAYRAGMDRPWPRACGWRHALLRSLAITLRLTVSRASMEKADIRRAVNLARWIADAPEVDDWLLTLTT